MALIEYVKLMVLTQYSLLAEHYFTESFYDSKRLMQTVVLFLSAETKHLILECSEISIG